MKTKYLASVEFYNGRNATAESNNLRDLIGRIKRGFAGEKTDWGWEASDTTVSSAVVYYYPGQDEKIVWEYAASAQNKQKANL